MAEPSPLRVLIVDDHYLVRQGLAAVLGQEKDLHVVGDAGDAEQAVEAHRRLKPDVTLLDLRIPGDGVNALRAIRAGNPRALVVMLTAFSFEEDVHRAFSAGANGYLLKSADHAAIASAVRDVAAGRPVVPEPIAAILQRRQTEPVLTTRELQVLRLMVEGKTNKEIASEIGFSAHTAKMHVTQVIAKLGASDRTQAVSIAFRRGLATF